MKSQKSSCFFSSDGPFLHFVKSESFRKFVIESNDKASSFKIFVVDGEIATKEDLFLTFAQGLSFPDYFGNNWDAFDECLNDLSWINSEGFLVVIEKGDDIMKMPPNEVELFFSIITDSIENWQNENKPIHYAFIGSDMLLQRIKAMVGKEICIHLGCKNVYEQLP